MLRLSPAARKIGAQRGTIEQTMQQRLCSMKRLDAAEPKCQGYSREQTIAHAQISTDLRQPEVVQRQQREGDGKEPDQDERCQ